MLIQLSEYLKPKKHLSSTYRGIVVDNNDPKKLKRVKILVEGLIEGDTADLPWCYQEDSSGLGNQPDLGIFAVPKIGSIVDVFFPQQNIYAPKYRNRYDATSKQSDFDVDYPDTYGLVDGDFKILVNRKQGTLSINHPAGTIINIAQDGTTNITSPKAIELDGSGGKIKLEGGKVAMGAGEELVDLFEQTLTELENTLCNLGLPVSNKAAFTAIKQKLIPIKGTL